MWREHCDKLEMKKTYSLQNTRLKESNGTRYLNTAKSEQFVFQEIPPFTQQLATDMESLSQNKMSAKIIAVQIVPKPFHKFPVKRKFHSRQNER